MMKPEPMLRVRSVVTGAVGGIPLAAVCWVTAALARSCTMPLARTVTTEGITSATSPGRSGMMSCARRG